MKFLLAWFLIPAALCAEPISLLSHGTWSYAEVSSAWPAKETVWQPYRPPGIPAMRIGTGTRVWIRCQFETEGAAEEMAIRLGMITDKDTAYLNGVHIGSTGTPGHSQPEAYDRIRVYHFSRDLLKPDGNELLLLVEAYVPGEIGIIQDTVEIGPRSEIEKAFERQEMFKLVLLSAYSTVAGYFLFKERENLFFALFAVSLVVYSALRNQLKYELGLPFVPMKRVEFATLLLVVPFFAHFVRSFFGQEWSRRYQFLDILMLLLFASHVILSDLRIHKMTFRSLVTPVWAAYIVVSIWLLAVHIRKGSTDAMAILAGTLILLAAATNDILVDRNLVVMPRLAGFAFAVFLLSMATVLANKFVRVSEQVEDYAEHLEQKVEERTKDVMESRERIQALKIAQDADYFLTSLLLHPLGVNRAAPGNVGISFLTKQKKEFLFKNRPGEIGGDICIADTVELQGETYTAFVNADAMGKSLQGAGGVLVLGSLFRAIVERTKSMQMFQDYSPERWIKSAVEELHRVFTAFDGSMMVSLFLGLVHEKSGSLYFVIAEHPMPVLYRNRTASFLEAPDIASKLGSPMGYGELRIAVVTLEPGDIIIGGSDGRDDLLIGAGEMNADESLFLKNVERGDGELFSIYESIRGGGQIVDDLSLVRIQFAPPEPPPRQSYRRELRREIQAFLDSARYEEAAAAARRYTAYFADDSEFLFVSSRIHHRAGQVERAVDEAERLRLRNPEHAQTANFLKKIGRG